ncbi:VOC family protein [Streptomyces sp. NPDC059989]|uniref:VOC family protein n=1 Tax=Streptomyces sp. NPDC059989 TaxID=3347026 RepID=UPI0036A8BFE4
MTTRLVQINMKAQDDSALGRFWAEALGWSASIEEPGVTNLEPQDFTYPDPVAVCIDICRVPEPKTVKNRVHLDLATTSEAHQAVLRSAKGVGPYLEFLRTPDAKTVQDRVHLDIRPYRGGDAAAEAARLRALGATDIDFGQGDVPWTCLADPEGNEFCVLAPA